MVLLKDIAFWAVVALLQLASGYQVAKISLRVEGVWKNHNQGSIKNSAVFRILFFPASAADKLNEYRLYIFIHMLFWEIRIALCLIGIILGFVIAPLIALFFTITIGMIKSGWAVFKTALSTQAN